MITKLTGKLLRLGDDRATIEVPPFEYEVLIPEFTRRQLQGSVSESISLHTIHVLDGNPTTGGRMFPRLIGFMSEVEREFFDLICSVKGLGAKKALKAMVRPVKDIAKAIEQQDVNTVKTLPGVGPKMAELMIANLRRKMPKFALMADRSDTQDSADVERSIVDEVFQILCSMGHSESESRQLLDGPLATKKKFKDVEALFQAVYDTKTQS